MPSLDKRVHFAPENTFYSPPATPSPTFSEVSLPNSEGPATPPTFTATLPAATAATEHGTRIHTALAFRPGVPFPIKWDVTLRPDTLALHASFGDITPHNAYLLLAEAATSPPLPELELLCDQLPYVIKVHPGAALSAASPFTPPTRPLPSLSGPEHAQRASPMPFVTVHDVLTVLYTTLRLPLAQAEYARLPAATQTALAGAYNMRCARITDGRRQEDERRKGLKRVDFLIAAGRTRFGGLGATKKGRGVWVLNLG